MVRLIVTFFFGIMLSASAQAREPEIFIDAVQGVGDLALKAMELDKLICLAGTQVGESRKQLSLCAHEVKAMMQHFSMTQNLGIKSGGSLKGPDYYFQNTKIVFRAYVEMGKKKDGTPRPVLRVQLLEGGTPPALLREQTIPVSSIPEKHEIGFLKDLMLSLFRPKAIK